MKRELKVPTTYSFRRRLYSILYLLITLQIAGFVVYFLFFSYTLRRNAYRESRETLALYNAQITENLRGVDYFLMELGNYNRDISVVATQTDPAEHYGDIIRINNQFEFSLRSFQNILGLYAYFPRSDTWVGYSGSSESRQTFQPFLRDQLRSEEVLETIQGVNGLYWVPYNYEGDTYFVKTFYIDSTILGAWTNIDRLTSALKTLREEDTLIFYIDEDGDVLPSLGNAAAQEFSSLRIPVEKTKEDYELMTIGGIRYLVLTEPLSYCNYSIAALVPLSSIDRSFRDIFWYLILLLLVTLGGFLITERLLNRFMANTTGMMENITDAIVRGESDRRIELSGQRCEEILEMARSYNSMVDSIQSLKISVYEESLNRRTFQLYALRSQVAPHFLINCLNMISYLADGDPQHTEVIRQMIATLSRHLRYTLSTRDKVPLSEELHYLDNYVELSRLRFPGCITYEKEIDERALSAMVFPLILISLTENSFKYNLVMGESLKVIVRAAVSEDGSRVHLTHIDSGEGYSKEFLDHYHSGTREDFVNEYGHHIGIRNIYERMRLYYGDSVRLELSNEPGLGARNDIDIPFMMTDNTSSDTVQLTSDLEGM